MFTAANRPWCAVTLPHHAMSDAQVSAEYVVHAIRALHARAHRRISIVGYSQGGMLPRWALKFWPDTRPMVDDLVSLDASNHGTIDAYAACAIGGCAPSLWHQQSGSAFLRRLNASRETYAGISYSQIYSLTDEVVVPNAGPRASSSLRTGSGAIANVAVQSVCAIHVAGHLTMGTVDPVGYALVIDALTHSGTARASRISRRVCLRATMPGVSLASATLNLARVGATAAAQVVTYPHVRREPALAPYAR